MNTPLAITTIVIATALICEVFLMLFLKELSLSYKHLIFIDSFGLVSLLSPIMYFVVYRPLKKYDQMAHNDLGKNVKPIKKPIQICSDCNKIQGESGNWLELKKYLQEHFEIEVVDGLCSNCNKTNPS